MDVMPTVLEALGVENTGFMAGRSLLGQIQGKSIPDKLVFSERRIFTTVPKPFLAGEGYSVIQDNRHLIVSTAKDDELYDLEKDPRETRNLIDKEDVSVLNKKVLQWSGQLRPLFGQTQTESDIDALKRLKSLGYVQ